MARSVASIRPITIFHLRLAFSLPAGLFFQPFSFLFSHCFPSHRRGRFVLRADRFRKMARALRYATTATANFIGYRSDRSFSLAPLAVCLFPYLPFYSSRHRLRLLRPTLFESSAVDVPPSLRFFPTDPSSGCPLSQTAPE